jgi:hypothetical protein
MCFIISGIAHSLVTNPAHFAMYQSQHTSSLSSKLCNSLFKKFSEFTEYVYNVFTEFIIYHLFSFCGSVQDYKIHMDMEIVKFALKI